MNHPEQVILAGGGKYIGVQDNLVYFQNPATNNTLVLPYEQLEPEIVTLRLVQDSRKFGKETSHVQ